MKTLLKKTITGLLAIPLLALAGVTVLSAPAYAGNANGNTPDGDCGTNVNIVEGVDCAKGAKTQQTLFEEDADGNSLFKTITNVLLFLIGAVSVIMLIVGGLRYVLSNGDSTAVTNAKNTILYAVIGIIVALLAYAIVNFVISSFINNNG